MIDTKSGESFQLTPLKLWEISKLEPNIFRREPLKMMKSSIGINHQTSDDILKYSFTLIVKNCLRNKIISIIYFLAPVHFDDIQAINWSFSAQIFQFQFKIPLERQTDRENMNYKIFLIAIFIAFLQQNDVYQMGNVGVVCDGENGRSMNGGNGGKGGKAVQV